MIDIFKKSEKKLDKLIEENIKHNNKILNDLGLLGTEDFKNLMFDCQLNDFSKIEIVSEPQGINENESFGIIKEVYVDQWKTAIDSYDGYIYGKLEKNKWIKIPYNC